MKRILIALYILGLSVLTCLGQKNDYKLQIEDFSALRVTNSLNVDYFASADSAGWAYFTCSAEMASMLIFTNNKNQLTIELASDGVAYDDLPTIRVYSRSLTKVENAADSTVRVVRNTPVPNFKGKVIGNGRLEISNLEANTVDVSIATGRGHIVVYDGVTQQAKISSVGTGPIECGGLLARKIKTVVFGTGDIDCSPIEQLSVYGAGSGKVYYSGNPEKIVNRSLGVKVIKVGQTSQPQE